jgi:DNA-directed RNA polymerase subunit RPC12/RpoP
MKTYSNKSNAKRAAKKAGLNIEELKFIELDGKFGWIENKEIPSDVEGEREVEAEAPVVGNFVNCPDCGIHLSNGVSCYETQKQIAKQENAPEARIEKEYVCLACDHEFGEVVKTRKQENTSGKGLKIQKDREERNGIKRPSAGGKCAAAWELCDKVYKDTGLIPTPSMLKEESEHTRLNPNNVVIEMYQWRKFMGFVGRK